MEQEIMNIILHLIYNDRMEDLYNKRSREIEFPIKCSLPPNYKVLSDFSNEYFFDYEQILLENAVVNALKNDELDYLNFLKDNIKNIRKSLEDEMSFRIKTSSLAIENIKDKLIDKNNIEKDTKIKIKYKSLFEFMNSLYITIEPITITYRNIILNFLNYTNNEDKEILLDALLVSHNFDDKLIELNSNIINKNNIKNIKNILVRLIFFDNYVYLKNNEKIEDNSHLKNIFDYDDFDYEEDNANKMEERLLEHINDAIKSNKYRLPEDNELRLNLYSYFISYNLYLKDTFKGNNTINNELDLKKINPLYKLEKINFNKK